MFPLIYAPHPSSFALFLLSPLQVDLATLSASSGKMREVNEVMLFCRNLNSALHTSFDVLEGRLNDAVNNLHYNVSTAARCCACCRALRRA